MKEKSIIEVGESRPAWEALEAYAREGIRRLLQQLLEEEMEEVLGRRRYERREGVDTPPGYRNGFGKPRRLSLMSGTITVRRPRVRGLEFYSRVLLLRRCDRNRAVARSFEGQSVYPDRTALDRRFHSGSLDFLLIRN